MRNIVGIQVKAARQLANPKLTQAQLAMKLQLEGWNIDRVGVAKIEIRLREVTDIEVKTLAKVLNVSISWLFGETDAN